MATWEKGKEYYQMNKKRLRILKRKKRMRDILLERERKIIELKEKGVKV